MGTETVLLSMCVKFRKWLMSVKCTMCVLNMRPTQNVELRGYHNYPKDVMFTVKNALREFNVRIKFPSVFKHEFGKGKMSVISSTETLDFDVTLFTLPENSTTLFLPVVE